MESGTGGSGAPTRGVTGTKGGTRGSPHQAGGSLAREGVEGPLLGMCRQRAQGIVGWDWLCPHPQAPSVRAFRTAASPPAQHGEGVTGSRHCRGMRTPMGVRSKAGGAGFWGTPSVQPALCARPPVHTPCSGLCQELDESSCARCDYQYPVTLGTGTGAACRRQGSHTGLAFGSAGSDTQGGSLAREPRPKLVYSSLISAGLASPPSYVTWPWSAAPLPT